MAYCFRPITEEEISKAKFLTFNQLDKWNDRIEARIQAIKDKYTIEQINMALEIQSEMNGIKYEYRNWKAAEEKMLKS